MNVDDSAFMLKRVKFQIAYMRSFLFIHRREKERARRFTPSIIRLDNPAHGEASVDGQKWASGAVSPVQ